MKAIFESKMIFERSGIADLIRPESCFELRIRDLFSVFILTFAAVTEIPKIQGRTVLVAKKVMLTFI